MATKYKKIKEMQDVVAAIQTAGDLDSAKNAAMAAIKLLAAYKKETIGADNTLYTYRCTACGLTCTFTSGIGDAFDTKFCFDEMKSGSGNFTQIDVSIGA